MQKQFPGGETIQTIYFGGGTPSLLSKEDIKNILQKLNTVFTVAGDAEITLETNPDDITSEQLQSWKANGINRLSIGIQSFYEEELNWMNRAHNATQAKTCIELSLAAGFQNITIDLIYGSPMLTDQMWEDNVKTAINYGIPHLSCYALTVEERTPLHKHISNNEKTDVDNEQQARQFLLLMQWLREAGYEHYEVSNFAKPGFRSRHNSSYWKGEKYLGIGPSAHSYDGQNRSWNIANNNAYIQAIKKGHLPSEKEELSATQKLNEYLMISLRTMEGIDINKLKTDFTSASITAIEKKLIDYVEKQLIIKENDHYKLTDEGMLRADGIAGSLFE